MLKKTLKAFLVLLSVGFSSLCAQPTPGELRAFLGLPTDASGSLKDVEPKKDGPFGEVVWVKSFAPSESLYRYLIGMSKKGTFLRGTRSQVEQDIRNRPHGLRRMNASSFLYKEVMSSEYGEAFFTIDSVSEEGTSMIGFMTVGEHDFFVIEYAIPISKWREANPSGNPITPEKRLPDVLSFVVKASQKSGTK